MNDDDDCKLNKVLEIIYQNKSDGDFIDWLYAKLIGEEK